jgi:hypothetical protein
MIFLQYQFSQGNTQIVIRFSSQTSDGCEDDAIRSNRLAWMAAAFYSACKTKNIKISMVSLANIMRIKELRECHNVTVFLRL